MKIAILGATSQIAKDLIVSFSARADHELHLFARRPEAVTQWLASAGLSGRYAVDDFPAFKSELHFDAILNSVGVGNPAQAVAMGASIFDVTLKYDELALDYVRQHPGCRYIFLSSGAAYGSSFDQPVDENTNAVIAINHLRQQDWYGVAKLYAECRHRSLPHLAIVDIRVFNYVSHTQDVHARFLITDILRAIQSGEPLKTSSDNIVRDYIGPDDFYSLSSLVLEEAQGTNKVIDCYTMAPVDKLTLLSTMKQRYGLIVQFSETRTGLNATGTKKNYFSINRAAEKFGYMPKKTSLETIVQEFDAFIGKHPVLIANEAGLKSQ
jgi:nucleoside-diphosphate-sugar epimerase